MTGNFGGVTVQECRLGRGVFATKPFAEGEEILWLHGRVVGLSEVLQASNELQGYPLQIAADPALYLDLTGTDAQYLNHSCTPNAAAQDTLLVARRAIQPGEEITFDYSTTAAADGWVMTCLCGSPACRGAIVSDFSTLAVDLQARYLRDASVPSFIVRWLRHHGIGLGAGIPEFPRFSPFTSALLPEYRRLTGSDQVLSEFSPMGLLLTVHDPQVSQANGNVILRSSDFLSGEPHYTFTGGQRPLDTALALLAHSQRALGNSMLRYVPETALGSVTGWADSGLRRIDRPDRADYVFSTAAITSGATGGIRRRQSKANRFLNLYPHAEFKVLDLRQLQIRREIRALFDTWSAGRLSPAAIVQQRSALNLTISLAPLCPTLATGIYVADRLVGVAISELCGAGAVDHFSFTAPGYDCAPLLVVRTARVLRDICGIEVWNYQEALNPQQAIFKKSWGSTQFRYCDISCTEQTS